MNIRGDLKGAGGLLRKPWLYDRETHCRRKHSGGRQLEGAGRVLGDELHVTPQAPAAEYRIETLPREISSVSARAVCWSNRQDDLKLRPAGATRRCKKFAAMILNNLAANS